jgi:signal transduction histidine kinase
MRNARLATVGVLAAGVAHEINNPNNAILFNAGVLGRAWPHVGSILENYARENGDFALGGLSFVEARETLPRLLSEIAANSQRISRIVEGLKHLSKRDKGDLDESVDIAKTLGAATMILHNEIHKRTDCFTLEVDDQLPAVKGNSQQLEQVFINILLNALQALPSRERGVAVRAGLSDARDQVVVRVTDQGMGIKPEYLSRLQEPFFTTKLDSGGTGLGLSISFDIIARLRGRIELDSTPGVGTTVTIRLPNPSVEQG